MMAVQNPPRHGEGDHEVVEGVSRDGEWETPPSGFACHLPVPGRIF
jgi:hypothetical protein